MLLILNKYALRMTCFFRIYLFNRSEEAAKKINIKKADRSRYFKDAGITDRAKELYKI